MLDTHQRSKTSGKSPKRLRGRIRTGDVAHRVHEVCVRDAEPASAVNAKAADRRACVARELHDIARGFLPRLLRGWLPRLLQLGLRCLLRAPGTSPHDALNMKMAAFTGKTHQSQKAQ